MTEAKRGCCAPKTALKHRPPLTADQLDGLRELFKSLANDTRLRILHALVRSGELRVTELAETVEATTQAVSNQLRRLSGMGVLASRRDGNSIFYRIADPCAATLMDTSLCLLEDAGTAGQRGRRTAWAS